MIPRTLVPFFQPSDHKNPCGSLSLSLSRDMNMLLAPLSVEEIKPSSMPPTKRRDFDRQLAHLQRCDSTSTAKVFQPEASPIQCLLRALQHSQTRAREAEKKVLLLSKQHEEVARMLLEESLRLHAHKQWVRMLEIQVSILNNIPRHEKRKHSGITLRGRSGDGVETAGDEEDVPPAAGPTWHLALLLCLGIAGVGLCFGQYGF